VRKLLLIRHAKSSWKHEELDDHERPLNKRGERDIITMARHLADKDLALDVIFSSTATRALDFAQMLSNFLQVSLVPDLSFYTFSEDEMLEILRNLPDNASRVAVVAHNPAITRVVNQITQEQIDNVPTAGIAEIDCSIESWAELGALEGQSELNSFEYPKMIS